MTTFVI